MAAVADAAEAGPPAAGCVSEGSATSAAPAGADAFAVAAGSIFSTCARASGAKKPLG